MTGRRVNMPRMRREKSRRRESLCLRAARASRELIRQFARAERTPCVGPGGASVLYSDKRRVSERSCKKYTSPTRLTRPSPRRLAPTPNPNSTQPRRIDDFTHSTLDTPAHRLHIPSPPLSPTTVPSPLRTPTDINYRIVLEYVARPSLTPCRPLASATRCQPTATSAAPASTAPSA
jgi:hypothetical protein